MKTKRMFGIVTMIATFLADHDFSGKTVIPFCTSASDDIDNSLHIFSELCPDAEIAEGLTANDLNDIEPWLQGLGLNTVEPIDDETENPEITDTAEAGSGNILIAYFSVMETDGVDTVAGASRVAVAGEVLGNNQYIAQIIQRETGGDLFSIETVQEYPTTHDPLLEFAYNEKADNARPELATQIENSDSYDVIFLGYPSWNADLPMPLYTFLEEYDFSGKTIIPFTTHGGSGFSRTVQTISEL
ncbi:MAG: flavodoxin [Eubacteriales bacterium]|nr:flavodoxin [Eubacteriales bacterium]